jgi:hypothetical protein
MKYVFNEFSDSSTLSPTEDYVTATTTTTSAAAEEFRNSTSFESGFTETENPNWTFRSTDFPPQQGTLKCRSSDCPRNDVVFKAHGPLTGYCIQTDRFQFPILCSIVSFVRKVLIKNNWKFTLTDKLYPELIISDT